MIASLGCITLIKIKIKHMEPNINIILCKITWILNDIITSLECITPIKIKTKHMKPNINIILCKKLEFLFLIKIYHNAINKMVEVLYFYISQ